MRAPRRKTIAGALFAALFLAAIALAGNNLSGTSTRSAALNVSHMSGPASQFASSTGSTKGTPAAPSKGANPQGITVGRSYKNAISPPARSLVHSHGTGQLQARPELPLLIAGKPLRQANDPVVQDTMPTPKMPSPILNFPGIPFPGVVCNCAPPDTNGEVGLTQYVQIVNEGFQVFDKTTGIEEAPAVPISSLWTGFGGLCEFNGFGDPVVVYDQLANRWVITQFAGNATPNHGPVHRRVDRQRRTGHVRRVRLPHDGRNFYDYPKFGVWPDAYYASANIFNASGTAFLGPAAYAFDRDAMLAGTAATFIEAPMGSPSDDSYMPADLDGLVPPPAGAPNPYVEHRRAVHVAGAPLPRRLRQPTELDIRPRRDADPRPVHAALRRAVPQLGVGDATRHASPTGACSATPTATSATTRRSWATSPSLLAAWPGVRWFEVNNATSGTPGFNAAGHLPARQHLPLDGQCGHGRQQQPLPWL